MKPKLDDLLPKKTRKPTVPQAKLEPMMIDVWLPHFVAFAFRIEDSIRAAFPKKQWNAEMASRQASRLISNPIFTDKMVAHIAKLDQECAIDERFVLSGLYHQALANIYEYFETDDQGHRTLIPPERLSLEQQRNVKKLRVHNRVVETKDEKRITEQRIEMEIVDSQKAYALLGKAIGMFIERIKVEVQHNLADKLEQALEREKRLRLEAPKRVH